MKVDPCIGCEYYNKPYWSVVSPCTSCPRRNSINGYISTDTITITVGNCDNTITRLPTAKEYSEMAQKTAFQFTGQWSEPKYQCPKCDGGMRKDLTMVIDTYPAQYKYQCDKCGHTEYQYM